MKYTVLPSLNRFSIRRVAVLHLEAFVMYLSSVYATKAS